MFLKILKSIAKVHSLHSHIHSTTWQLARLKNLYSKKSTHLSFWCLLIQIKKTKDSKFRSYLALLLWCNGSNALAKIGNLVKLLLLFNSIFQHTNKDCSVIFRSVPGCAILLLSQSVLLTCYWMISLWDGKGPNLLDDTPTSSLALGLALHMVHAVLCTHN